MKPQAFLALVRIPTIFSSMSNAYAGYFIGGGRVFSMALALGILAAGLFIMAGMALNDIADKDVDAVERPSRPIPSGAISLKTAWLLSLSMMGTGLLFLSLANLRSALVGLFLCICIFSYNFLFKGKMLGPVIMGLCRLLNLLTGITLAWPTWPRIDSLPPTLAIALLSLWAYIAIVTYLARDEVSGNSQARKRNYFWLMGLWLAVWLVVAFKQFPSIFILPLIWVLLVMLLRRPLQKLWKSPSPKHTGQMVGTMLRLVPIIDVLAMLVNHVPPTQALIGVLWVIPAYTIGKLFYST